MGSSQKYLRLLVLMSSNAISTPERWFACARLLNPYLTGHVDPPFVPMLTTTVFSQCRSRRFEASPCRWTSEGHKSSITSVASRTSQMSTPHLIRIAAAHANTRGSWQPLTTLDSPQPERTPLPRPDLRKCHVALGPVAVFGSSNFPLAFSVAGGDTGAAFAAGCPVVVKAHGAHPGTSELVGRAVQAAVAECSLPEGTFSLIQGVGNAVGEALVDHPAICAVGFTGSRAGGLALSRRAAARDVPIPVYAEMSSINPVVLLPQALSARAENIGQAFADSLTMGVGQFCTNPGIVIAITGPELENFVDATAQSLRNKVAGVMLTPGIAAAYAAGVKLLAEHERVETIAMGQATSGRCDARAHFFATDAASFLSHAEMRDELFGPSSLLVRCRDVDEMADLLGCLDGQLTATLQMDSGDVPLARRLLPLLEDKVGRILVNGFPTGVEVSHAMVHGGPFPATTDSRSTSVGSAAIDRFLRPVCYQNFPVDLLPAALSDVNVLAIPRVVDGNFVLAN